MNAGNLGTVATQGELSPSIGMMESHPEPERTEAFERGIIVFSHLRWNFVWQRPQQFLSRFAAMHPILFVEEPIFDLAEGEAPRPEIHQAQENVTTLALHVPPVASQHQLETWRREAVRNAIAQQPQPQLFNDPILWYYSPMDFSWTINHFNGHTVVYDCMDELSLFHGAPKELVEEEGKLLRRADIVFVGGKNLADKKREQHNNVHFFGCGVEYQHFSQAQQQGDVPADIKDLPRPIIGWFGVIDERMNYELLAKMARLRPEWSFVLVGPVVKVDPASLPQAANIHWVGQREYRELPLYCRGYDVCMMPFALNESTRYINPTKALEYLATGRPVISTPVQDVVAQYQETIAIAGTAEEFIAEIESALANKSERIDRGIERAKACSWEATVAQMNQLIKDTQATRKASN